MVALIKGSRSSWVGSSLCICCKSRNSTAGSNTIPTDVKTKTCCLRTAFVGSMMAAAIICGCVTFATVRQYEYDLVVQSYYSVVTSAVANAQAIAQRKITSGKIMVSLLSHNFPNASLWPFVEQDGFTQTGSIISDISLSSLALGVIVLREQATEFERFAENFYATQGYPPNAGRSDFGFGIWEESVQSRYDDGRIRSTDSNTSYDGKFDIMVPIFKHTNTSSLALMYNAYSQPETGSSIDKMLQCTISSRTTETSCAILSGFVELKTRPGLPGTILYEPIYPSNSPNDTVAYVSTLIFWDDTLKNIVPDFIKGLYCVVSSSLNNESFTYFIEGGIPVLLGRGDLHNPSHDEYKKTVAMTNNIDVSSISAHYNLTIYPSDAVFQQSRQSKRLWAIPLGFVAVIVFSTTLFILYDIIMRNEAKQQEVILEVKRRFVRFVSHEIRTPLNTVCLGLELLQSDIAMNNNVVIDNNDDEKKAIIEGAIVPKSAPNENPAAIAQIVDDILENANNAVGILNDLLNYDKMEQGTFNLEVSLVDIWDVISRTVSSFDIQAKKRSMQLTCIIDRINQNDSDDDSNDETIESPIDLSCLKVMGDDVRIRQVVRNVISNSLKFSPEGTGKINVTMRNNPKGLPNAIPPRATDIVNAASSNVLSSSYPRAGSIQISVEDNGVGVTESQILRLFQEGVQFEPNKLQDGGGSGLGLHITKRLVEQHGGTIIMLSDGLNCGCTTIIELPLFQCPSNGGSSQPFASSALIRPTNTVPTNSATIPTMVNNTTNLNKVESASDNTNSTSSIISSPSNAIVEGPETNNERSSTSRKILVVDDSLPNRKMLVRLLERSGHVCLSAINGQEAVDMMEADNAARMLDSNHIPIDSILMDYEMPIMNGPDATKIIRSKGFTKVLIIGVTGNVLTEDVNYFKAHGANTVLPKPVKIASLEEYWETYSN